MKKLSLLVLTLSLIACESSVREIKRRSDFPCVVVKIENNNSGLYLIQARNANGNYKTFSSNVKHSIGDTLTLCVNTTHAFS